MNTPQRTHPRAHRPRLARFAALTTVACLASVSLIATMPAAHAAGEAATTLPGTILHGGAPNDHPTTVFAFVKTGEAFAATFGEYPGMDSRMTVTITDPHGKVRQTSAPGGPVAIDTQIVSDIDGVWSVTITDPADIGTNRPQYPGVTWSIAAEKDGVAIPGRVFSESLAFNTPAETTLSLFALTKTGGLYRETLRDYNGVDSTIQVTNKGNVLADDPSCDPAYLSVPMPRSSESDGSGAAYEQPTSSAACAGLERYRLFLDQPAADLPASVANWADGRTTETWVGATYTAPTISGLAFARSGTASNAGTLTGTLDTQPGTVNLEIDADGDGVFDGPADVTQTLIVPQTGPFTFEWDGKNARGELVDTATTSAFRTTLAQTNEAHFLRVDTEISRGGIELLRLTGGSTNPSVVYFDDSRFADTSAERYSGTSVLASGPDGIDSTGGVHRWTGDDTTASRSPNANTGTTGSWGDQRSIDDWTFGAESAVASVAIDPLTPHLSIEKHGAASTSPLLAGSTIDYTVILTSDGTGDFTTTNPAEAVDHLDQGVLDQATLVEDSIATTTGTATIDAQGRLVWNAGALPVGATSALTFSVTVLPNDAPARADIVNTACIASAPHRPSTSEYGTDENPCATVPFTPPVPPTPATPPTVPPTTPPATPPAPRVTPPGLASTGADNPLVMAGLATGTVLLGAAVVGLVALRRRRSDAAASASASASGSGIPGSDMP
jgi:hypothetical protein